MDDKITAEQEELINRTMAEMEFYNQYKEFIAEVKTTFLQKGPEAARGFIKSKTDHILTIACDEMFWSLFNKL